MYTLKSAKILCVVFLFYTLLMSPKTFATVTIPPSWHGGKFPSDNCYISFSKTHTFNNVYRDENNFWFFNDYGFYVKNANATITNFFDTDSNLLELTLYASTETISELRVYIADKGIPIFVSINEVTYNIPFSTKTEFDNFNGNCWFYNPSNNILYIKAQHHSPVSMAIGWTLPYVAPTPQPTPTPTPTPTPPAPTNYQTLTITVTLLIIIVIVILSKIKTTK